MYYVYSDDVKQLFGPSLVDYIEEIRWVAAIVAIHAILVYVQQLKDN